MSRREENMQNGYAGKVLYIDLTTKNLHEEGLPDRLPELVVVGPVPIVIGIEPTAPFLGGIVVGPNF